MFIFPLEFRSTFYVKFFQSLDISFCCCLNLEIEIDKKRHLNVENLSCFINLVKLSLHNVMQLDNNTLDGLRNLEHLEISNLALVDKPFMSLGALKTLLIRDCDFAKSSEDVFLGLLSLETLKQVDCENYKHVSYGHQLKSLKSLTIYALQNLNILKTLPETLLHISINMHYRAFRCVQLKEALEGMEDSSIEKLELPTDFEEFDFKTVSGFRNLKSLILNFGFSQSIIQKGQFSVLPGALKLTNQLESSTQLASLRVIDLSSNRYLNLEEKNIFKHLTHVEELYMNNCNVVNYNCEFKYNPKIYSHDCGPLDKHMFMGLDSLKILDLSSTGLQTVDPEMFVFIPNLQNLNLSKNKFRNIKIDTFCNLDNLKKLDLSQNIIENIEEGAFRHLKSLETLSLISNRFKSLGENTFEGLDNLEHLYLKQFSSLADSQFLNHKSLNNLKDRDKIFS